MKFPRIFWVTGIYVFLIMTSGVLNLSLSVTPMQQAIKIGDNMTSMCKLNDKEIQYCRFAIPGITSTFNLGPKTGGTNIKYYGAGFKAGECGLLIEKVEEKHNGRINCSVGTEDHVEEISGSTVLIILRTPKPPEFTIHGGVRKYYMENDILNITCMIRSGRPAPEVFWFLGSIKPSSLDTVLLKAEVHTRIIELGNDLYTAQSNISHIIKASDDGKYLKCMTMHPGLTKENNYAETLIIVKFPPKPLDLPIQHFDLVEGTDVEIDVVVNANPKPEFIWTIGNSTLYEGGTSERFNVMKATDMGNMTWKSVLSINNLIESDVEKMYKVTAKNDLGMTEYNVLISTKSRPKQDPELGSGIMIAVAIVVILLVVIVFIICFTRSQMRCCSAANQAEEAPRLDDGHEAHELDPIDFSSLFRLANDRIVPEVEDQGGEACAPDSPEERDVVYAELDLKPRTQETLVRGSDKTEYAEIIHRQN